VSNSFVHRNGAVQGRRPSGKFDKVVSTAGEGPAQSSAAAFSAPLEPLDGSNWNHYQNGKEVVVPLVEMDSLSLVNCRKVCLEELADARSRRRELTAERLATIELLLVDRRVPRSTWLYRHKPSP
jgi:hypothetical protein